MTLKKEMQNMYFWSKLGQSSPCRRNQYAEISVGVTTKMLPNDSFLQIVKNRDGEHNILSSWIKSPFDALSNDYK